MGGDGQCLLVWSTGCSVSATRCQVNRLSLISQTALLQSTVMLDVHIWDSSRREWIVPQKSENYIVYWSTDFFFCHISMSQLKTNICPNCSLCSNLFPVYLYENVNSWQEVNLDLNWGNCLLDCFVLILFNVALWHCTVFLTSNLNVKHCLGQARTLPSKIKDNLCSVSTQLDQLSWVSDEHSLQFSIKKFNKKTKITQIKI